MSHLNINQTLQIALQHHGAGQLAEAEQLYRRILGQQPNQPDALHYLGVIAAQLGRNDAAVDLIGRAIALKPRSPEAHHDLGEALRAQAKFDGAIRAYKDAIALRPNYAEAHCHLGIAFGQNGQLDEAVAAFRAAIAFKPDYHDGHRNLGVALAEKGEIDEAVVAYRRAAALNPNDPESHLGMGDALRKSERIDEAIAAYRRAIARAPAYAQAHHRLGVALGLKGQVSEAIAECRRTIALKPGYAQAYSDLGAALKEGGHLDEAIAACREAIVFKPDHPQAYNNLANAFKARRQLDEAVAAYRQAVALDPNYAEAQNNLGLALTDRGELDEAIAAFRRAMALKPNWPEPHGNLLLALHYHPTWDNQAIAAEHRDWNRRYAEPLEKLHRPHANDRDPARRLRIGYVSADFRQHPVGQFLLPLFARHDKSRFEVFAYSQVANPTAMTERLRSLTDQWRNIVGLSDVAAADLIRQDRIDILVDLSGHTGGNRLLVFAAKPAPVQVSYLGYPGRTALSAIDYRLTDHLADPIDLPDGEALYRLGRSNWCFAEPDDSAPIAPPPVERKGHVTFGSFNNFAKITEPMMLTWSRILRRSPRSRLLLKASALGAETVRQRVRHVFAAQGIEADRLILRGFETNNLSHLSQYNEIDVALDTFPYHGTATTCDALWMGVPVITLAGPTHVSRVGVSLLTNAGLRDLVGQSHVEYIELAVGLASGSARLAPLRAGMRDRMRRSPLMDAQRYAADIEAGYRWMWSNYCATGGAIH